VRAIRPTRLGTTRGLPSSPSAFRKGGRAADGTAGLGGKRASNGARRAAVCFGNAQPSPPLVALRSNRYGEKVADAA
jgi:hypothetical protein